MAGPIRIIPHAPKGIPDCGSFELRFADDRQRLEVERLELREREQSDDQNQEAQNCQRYERALYYSIHDFHGRP
jgi:hypothetical protein